MKSIYSPRIFFTSICLLSVVGFSAMVPALAQGSMPSASPMSDGTKKSTSLNTADRQFVSKAAQSDLTEIQSSQLALKRSQNSQVLQYAREMIQAHTDSSNKLKPIATSLGLTLPKSVGAENQALLDRLKTLSGKQFDRVYMDGQTKGHTKTQAAFQNELQQGQNTDIKAFANEILPVVSMHLQMAKNFTAMR